MALAIISEATESSTRSQPGHRG